jgi:ABC-type glycerol-3-phosphate transport system substrate-binding protein
MLPLRVSDKYPMAVWGGAGSSFLVNDHSKNKEEAVAFLAWLTDKDQQAYFSEATNNLPSNKECAHSISGVLAQFADDMEITTHPNTWDVSEFPAVTEIFTKGIQRIILGEITPEKLARDVQQVKERELARKKTQR